VVEQGHHGDGVERPAHREEGETVIGKLLILGAAGLAAAILAARAGLFDDSEKGRKDRKRLGEQFRRFPLPHIQLVLPVSLVELESMDDALCECAVSSGAAAAMNEAQLLDLAGDVQVCTAGLLFPEIDWPPVHSDNPTIHQYWAILDQRYRRLIYTGELSQFCGLGEVAAAPTVLGLDPTTVRAGTKPLILATGSFSPAATIQFRREDGRRLAVEIHERTPQSMQLVVDADEPGSYDLLAANGPNPASSINYQGALVVVQNQQE
jgi:hypothetical protein